MSESMLIEWIISITREEIMSYNRAVYQWKGIVSKRLMTEFQDKNDVLLSFSHMICNLCITDSHYKSYY